MTFIIKATFTSKNYAIFHIECNIKEETDRLYDAVSSGQQEVGFYQFEHKFTDI